MNTTAGSVAPVDSKVLQVEHAGPVATIWLSRPEAHNAFGPDMWSDLPVAMDEVRRDADAGAVVIAAHGASFTTGLDLKAFGPAIATEIPPDGIDRGSAVGNRKGLYELIKKWQGSISAVARCPKPVIAAIHGWCIGAGVDLITACDIRLAAADTILSVRETRLAMVADVGTLQRLPRIIGPGKVAELAFTGRDVTAAEAQSMGLVDHVYEDAAATQAAAATMAAAIAANSPLAVQGTKAVLAAAEGRSVEEALDYVALWNAAFLQSEDLREAVTAFVEKRPASFEGR